MEAVKDEPRSEEREKSEEKPKSGYGKRPLWQWVLLYLIIGVIVYFLIYYFVFAKKGGYNYSGSNQLPQSQQQPY